MDIVRKKNGKGGIGERYGELLQFGRFRPSEANRIKTLTVEAASDRGRILFSNSFRRLQSKTQVFDQERNAAVRTRLTHSLEVASVGRYIAELTAKKMVKNGWLGPLAEETTLDAAAAIVTIVEVACLMHDLGNPPFGHFGESTIQSWFALNQERFAEMYQRKLKPAFKNLYLDFLHFDGNPQGFRMATKLQWVRDEFGYNLTHTQLSATLKYPWTTPKVGTEVCGKIAKKAGVFLSEETALRGVQSALGLADGARHPLAYLMEAADDISYCLSDIEDALEKRVITAHEFVQFLRDKARESTNQTVTKILQALPDESNRIPENESPVAWYVKFRTDMTNALVTEAADLFLKHQDEVLEGAYFDLLEKSDTAETLLGAVKSFSSKHLYTCEVVRKRELVGFEVITGILERFGMLLDLPSEQAYELLNGGSPKVSPKHRLAPTLVSFLGRKQVLAYRHSVATSKETTTDTAKQKLFEWFARAHLIADYVSGMTDDYAIVTFQRLYAGGLLQI